MSWKWNISQLERRKVWQERRCAVRDPDFWARIVRDLQLQNAPSTSVAKVSGVHIICATCCFREMVDARCWWWNTSSRNPDVAKRGNRTTFLFKITDHVCLCPSRLEVLQPFRAVDMMVNMWYWARSPENFGQTVNFICFFWAAELLSNRCLSMRDCLIPFRNGTIWLDVSCFRGSRHNWRLRDPFDVVSP